MSYAPPSAPAPTDRKPVHKQVWFWLLLLLPGSCCCVGVGAAVAVPMFIRYVKSAKAEEARANVEALRQGVATYCTQRGSLPGAAGPLPDDAPGQEKRMFPFDPAFTDVGFAPSGPVLYSYSLVPDVDGLVIRIEGDIDGDGMRSSYVSRCHTNCVCEPVVETDSLE